MTEHKDDHRFFGVSRGTYAIQFFYFLLFTAIYGWLFWELSRRWPLR